MDLTYNAEQDAYRQRIRSILADNLPAGWSGIGALNEAERAEFLPRWRQVLIDNALIAPGVPEEFGGGGRGTIEQSIVAEELTRVGAPAFTHPNDSLGFKMLIPTLLNWGTDEQKRRFIPSTLTGDIRWAQGYSEPEAGSDLFSVRTTAVQDGDEWVVNGQKIWQTAGVTANWIFALVVTDASAARGRRLSFLMIPIDQPGVVVRGIRNTVGDVEFAEVFLTDARTSLSNTVGAPGDGARVALTLLGFERGSGGVALALSDRIEIERLIALAKHHGVSGDPLIRQRIVRCYTNVHVLHCLALKSLSAGASGRPPGPESSVAKLITSEHRKTVTELAMDILGRDSLVMRGAAPVETLKAQPLGVDPLSARAWVTDYLQARPATVYGGSSEIQRTTISERVLGLPREPRIAIATGR